MAHFSAGIYARAGPTLSAINGQAFSPSMIERFKRIGRPARSCPNIRNGIMTIAEVIWSEKNGLPSATRSRLLVQNEPFWIQLD